VVEEVVSDVVLRQEHEHTTRPLELTLYEQLLASFKCVNEMFRGFRQAVKVQPAQDHASRFSWTRELLEPRLWLFLLYKVLEQI
jgi:hypothetical protein